MKTLAVLVLLCTVMVLTGAIRRRNQIRRATYCPIAWTAIKGRCFRFISASMSWGKAEKHCQAIGGHLASVHNAGEYRKIQKMISKATRGFPQTWLGGSDCQDENIWLWSDGTPFNYMHCGTFDNRWWRQHCLQMNYGGNKCWDDVQCSSSLPSVCALNTGKVVTVA
ncbi:ladderlectin-like [Seriola dumerili]|uniref:Ladderlectin-like n=1 Tax=Seriola dumerili TaxID=41447 RepID=A0A3B4U4Z2_SERDU|nr:ladderlectin-like [Seriola dumerili]